MTSNRRDFDDHAFDFEALLSDKTARDDTSLSNWAQGPDRRPAQPPPASARVQGATAVRGTKSRGQLLSWSALILSLGLSALLGFGVYRALDSIDVTSASSLAAVSDGTTLPAVALVGLVITLAAAIVALFVSRPRLVATLALVQTMLLPIVAVLLAVHYGVNALLRNAQQSANAAGVEVTRYVRELVSGYGIDAGPLWALIQWFMR